MKKSICKIFENGDKRWYLNGKLYREDGPAVEWANGSKFWYINDQQHREDGPAVECANGNKYWYYHSKKLNCQTNEEFFRLLKLKAFW
jgi:hypothetical protein